MFYSLSDNSKIWSPYDLFLASAGSHSYCVSSYLSFFAEHFILKLYCRNNLRSSLILSSSRENFHLVLPGGWKQQNSLFHIQNFRFPLANQKRSQATDLVRTVFLLVHPHTQGVALWNADLMQELFTRYQVPQPLQELNWYYRDIGRYLDIYR